MSLHFLTGNPGKLAGARLVFPDIKSLDIDLVEIQSLDAKKIIEHKLKEGLKHHKGDLLVEDTSLYIRSLNNLPGPFIKWFLEALGNQGLAELTMKYTDHYAEAQCIIGYAKNDANIQYFEGVQKGQIVMPRGDNGFGWNPIFQPERESKTFAEMDDQERSKYSPRTKAFMRLRSYLDTAAS